MIKAGYPTSTKRNLSENRDPSLKFTRHFGQSRLRCKQIASIQSTSGEVSEHSASSSEIGQTFIAIADDKGLVAGISHDIHICIKGRWLAIREFCSDAVGPHRPEDQATKVEDGWKQVTSVEKKRS